MGTWSVDGEDDAVPVFSSSPPPPPPRPSDKKRISIYAPPAKLSLGKASLSLAKAEKPANPKPQAKAVGAKAKARTSSSSSNGEDGRAGGYEERQEAKQEVRGKLSKLDDEIASIDDQIETLILLSKSLKVERQGLASSLSSLAAAAAASSRPSGANGHGASDGGEDYTASTYDWGGQLKKTMKSVFGIDGFRLCQEGVSNANMDGRDLICIMPTGGGKSLTYQLPALLTPGTTVVISPLLSLISDQIMHLHDNNIPAVMLTGAVSKEVQRDIFARLVAGPSRKSNVGASGSGGPGAVDGSDGREIKLLYVTPEKVSKSKTFTSMLQKVNNQGRLARIVIDEAHCVSQMGHDYRPDYKKLSILRQLFPDVPLMAVTATCSRKVLPDLLKILGMKPITPSTQANAHGTVFFDAPLYRKNLRYEVRTKPANAKEAMKVMADYIGDNHSGESGIVYCLSKKDAETVAAGLQEASSNAIKTGVYHADIQDTAKENLHRRWREGKVNVVVATIAFGLGIDKGDVRFVLHHSLSKSLDGYYQETGRAGRDGEEASCVLYYRGQDAMRMSSLICGDVEAQPKLHDMVSFAQDVVTCRKTLFGRYFSTSASLPSKAWSEKEERCGHCDNCSRDSDSIETIDVTVAAWKICKIASEVHSQGGRLTLSNLADLSRGLGKGAFDVVETNKKGRKRATVGGKETLDLEEVCGGKVSLDKEACEVLVMDLTLKGYLAESFTQTAYSVNVYSIPGPFAARLTRHPLAAIEEGAFASGPLECSFLVKSRKKRKTSMAGSKGKAKEKAGTGAKKGPAGKGKEKARGRSSAAAEDEEDEDEDGEVEEGDDDDDDDEDTPFLPPSKRSRPSAASSSSKTLASSSSSSAPSSKKKTAKTRVHDSDEDEDDEADWAMREIDAQKFAGGSGDRDAARSEEDEEEDWAALEAATDESLWDEIVRPVRKGSGVDQSSTVRRGRQRSVIDLD